MAHLFLFCTRSVAGTNGGFLKWGYHQIIHLNRIFHYKPSILRVFHFRKPPNLGLRFACLAATSGSCPCPSAIAAVKFHHPLFLVPNSDSDKIWHGLWICGIPGIFGYRLGNMAIMRWSSVTVIFRQSQMAAVALKNLSKSDTIDLQVLCLNGGAFTLQVPGSILGWEIRWF